MHYVQSCGGALLLPRLQMLQVLLSLLLAMAAFHRWFPSAQATHSHLQDAHVSRDHDLRNDRPIKSHLYSLKLILTEDHLWGGGGAVAMVNALPSFKLVLTLKHLKYRKKLFLVILNNYFPFFIHNPTLLSRSFSFFFSQQLSTGFQLVHITLMFYSALSLISLSPHLQTIFTTLVNPTPLSLLFYPHYYINSLGCPWQPVNLHYLPSFNLLAVPRTMYYCRVL